MVGRRYLMQIGFYILVFLVVSFFLPHCYESTGLTGMDILDDDMIADEFYYDSEGEFPVDIPVDRTRSDLPDLSELDFFVDDDHKYTCQEFPDTRLSTWDFPPSISYELLVGAYVEGETIWFQHQETTILEISQESWTLMRSLNDNREGEVMTVPDGAHALMEVDVYAWWSGSPEEYTSFVEIRDVLPDGEMGDTILASVAVPASIFPVYDGVRSLPIATQFVFPEPLEVTTGEQICIVMHTTPPGDPYSGLVVGYDTGNPFDDGYFVSDTYAGVGRRRARQWDLAFIAKFAAGEPAEGYAVSVVISPSQLLWWHSLDWSYISQSGDYAVRMILLGQNTDGTWSTIQDDVLPGNEHGFDTSPVDLCSLPVEQFPKLKLKAVFPPVPPDDRLGLTGWSLRWVPYQD